MSHDQESQTTEFSSLSRWLTSSTNYVPISHFRLTCSRGQSTLKTRFSVFSSFPIFFPFFICFIVAFFLTELRSFVLFVLYTFGQEKLLLPSGIEPRVAPMTSAFELVAWTAPISINPVPIFLFLRHSRWASF